MSDTTQAVVLAVFTLAFRSLGRSYLLVGAPAFLIALVTGAGLASGRAATLLRAAIGLLTLALVVLGSLLAT